MTLGEHYDALARAYVKSGRYTSVSEVIREGLRLLEMSDEGFSKRPKLNFKTPSEKGCEWYNNRQKIFENELVEIKREVIEALKAEGNFKEAKEPEREFFGNINNEAGDSE